MSAINIHNYEEYFLLYADGELSAEENAAVKSFINEHPELRQALNALLESRLDANDKIIFEDKASLFKTDNTGISLNNYEEYFLLYVDDELSNEQKNEVEKFVLQHPALQNEFTLLKQTKLPDDEIEFADKESLYKKEIIARPVISIGWKRLAIAASVIGLIFATWIFYPKKSNNIHQSIAVKNKPQVKNKQNETEFNSSPVVQQNNSATGKRQKNMATVIHLQKNNQAQKIIPVSKINVTNTTVPNDNDYVITDEPKINDAGEIAIIGNNKTVQTVRMTKHLPNHQSTIVPVAITTNNDEDTNKQNNTIYVANIRINKNKFSNFIKKAKSIINFNGNNESNSIAIANFTISK